MAKPTAGKELDLGDHLAMRSGGAAGAAAPPAPKAGAGGQGKGSRPNAAMETPGGRVIATAPGAPGASGAPAAETQCQKQKPQSAKLAKDETLLRPAERADQKRESVATSQPALAAASQPAGSPAPSPAEQEVADTTGGRQDAGGLARRQGSDAGAEQRGLGGAQSVARGAGQNGRGQMNRNSVGQRMQITLLYRPVNTPSRAAQQAASASQSAVLQPGDVPPPPNASQAGPAPTTGASQASTPEPSPGASQSSSASQPAGD